MWGRDAWSQVQFLALGILGLPKVGCDACGKASWGLETMGLKGLAMVGFLGYWGKKRKLWVQILIVWALRKLIA